jgi:AcrR family transcriptional regulator
MTQEDILSTAFTVWGRDYYRKMSLSDIAQELGVTKPALYRHFRNKDALLQAMRRVFFDDFARDLRQGFELLDAASLPSSPLEIARISARLLARILQSDNERLVYIFWLLSSSGNPGSLFAEELAPRLSWSPAILLLKEQAGTPDSLGMLFAISTVFYLLAVRHFGTLPQLKTDSEFEAILEKTISHGFGYTGKVFTLQEIEGFEKAAQLSPEDVDPGSGLLPAVAAAVAEAGPWNASMNLVARRSGLSKSGLYSHFRSREEMLREMFSSEFNRIADLMLRKSELSELPAARLYLALNAMAGYLSARPDVLSALEWVRVQRIHLGPKPPNQSDKLFAGIFSDSTTSEPQLLKPLAGSVEITAHWLFFLMNYLMVQACKKDDGFSWNVCVRELFFLILYGLEGEKHDSNAI